MIEYIFGLVGLLIASIHDFKSREIEDYIWISMVVFGFLYSIYMSFSTGNYSFLINSISGFVVCFILGYLMFLFGIGGGDGKILMGLGALVPKYQMPTYTILGSLLSVNYVPSFPIIVFINGMFFMIFLPIVILLRNLMKGIRPKNLRKFLLMCFGEKMRVKDAKEKNRLILGHENNFKLLPSADDDDFSNYNDDEEIWVTPMIPLIIPITVSYIVTPIIGDKIIHLIVPI
ncbi:MAG: archaeal preflagellin peptidase FlaK [Methanothermococcus sp.]|nr:archaeal preflagellin peptidase FlaK [Methanothermococcus sp.]